MTTLLLGGQGPLRTLLTLATFPAHRWSTPRTSPHLMGVQEWGWGVSPTLFTGHQGHTSRKQCPGSRGPLERPHSSFPIPQIDLYAGALFVHICLGWNFYLSTILMLAITALYTIAGTAPRPGVGAWGGPGDRGLNHQPDHQPAGARARGRAPLSTKSWLCGPTCEGRGTHIVEQPSLLP